MGRSHDEFVKYPRTPHLFGSAGTDDDKHLGEAESARFVADPSLIVEEKIDGTNAGIHFSSDAKMAPQCRGHLITEGMHPQYDLFKRWALARRPILEERLGDLSSCSANGITGVTPSTTCGCRTSSSNSTSRTDPRGRAQPGTSRGPDRPVRFGYQFTSPMTNRVGHLMEGPRSLGHERVILSRGIGGGPSTLAEAHGPRMLAGPGMRS